MRNVITIATMKDEEGLEKNIGEVPETWITNDEILNNMVDFFLTGTNSLNLHPKS